MFEKTLTDVVKGIRASKRDTALYISQCIAEIKSEINSSDMHVKANALQKLTFLQMMGYSMNWASFPSIEVMSSPRFAHKRIGYLAASQGFTQDTDVILLTTNLLKKELRGAVGVGMHGVYEAGLAVNCISNIVTEELAKDLLPEITHLTKHSQPYLRKKAILCLFKVFVKYPQGLRLTFEHIQKSLQDSDPSVVSCAVNVITELSDKNPRNYLHLAPAFFDLLTNSSNNWMLIKVVKLLGSLVPEEPRLARKLLEPLAKIVRTTQAKSLLFEAVHTVTLCLPYSRKSDGTMPAIVSEIVVLCAQTLRDFVEQQDQNLKYLGLVGFASLMQSHPKVLSAPDYRPLILACLSDQDVTIRSRALELLKGMASRKNLIELVAQLLKHVKLASGSYKQDLVEKIVEMCSSDKYALLADFEWYLDVLFKIGHMRGLEKHGDLLRAQIMDVALRVLPVRPFAVKRSIEILMEGDGNVSDNPHGDNGRGKRIIPDILPALAWIVGEYSDCIAEVLLQEDLAVFFNDESAGSYHSIIQVFSSPLQLQKYVQGTQKVFIQASMKVFAAALADKTIQNNELEACVRSLEEGLSVFIQSTDVEVMERAFTALETLKGLGIKSRISSGAPALTEVNDDSDDDDLLGMSKSAPGTSLAKGSKNDSLGTSIRDSSSYLSYILKAAPMKPIGSKVQRKKHESLGLPEMIDLSVFEKMINAEVEYRAQTRLSPESVCFTQQTPLISDSGWSAPASLEPVTVPSPGNVGDGLSSFQRVMNNIPSAALSRPRQSDPFYLDSAPSTGGEQFHQANAFGAIQLGDSDDDSAKDKKARKKKAKKERKETQLDPLAYFDAPASSTIGPSKTSVEIYTSDDEENDETFATNRKHGPGKEFASLAQIDLTTPLRDDEVMPERKHHVVADRQHVPDQTTSAKNKKEKKKKDKKTKKEKTSSPEMKNAVGDLLDLGIGFDPRNEVHASAQPSSILTSASHPINTAFDDLLGISSNSMHVLPPQSGNAVLSMVSSTSDDWQTNETRTWMRATLKPPASSSIDWSAVIVKYRVEQSPDGLLVIMMLENKSLAPLNDVVVVMKGQQPSTLGHVVQGSHSELKFGPFPPPPCDGSQEIKGHLQTQNEKASVKIVLPSFLHCGPEPGITLENVAAELGSSGWTTNTCKIPHTGALPPSLIRAALVDALRAIVVDGNDPSTCTLACRSSSGARVRVLVKIKESSVRLDIKATSGGLGESLAADLKRLAL
ncbi:AP-3 complex subunit delta [Fistulifera solaris]|uniref:AP-3 complex subunit delta n=1 Tax=Fistulifera solaris TaxID=1519565 RepID=A0A1Z5JET9_FISSO|nr:AP-3 complex subunit delta [Fistulifera solaris]|eukprot:GAX12525.1 AP-3 complex subunit delta [Fistulifera solaris]